MKRVYIASPFRGATVEETRQNIVYARLCMLDSLERHEAPYLSHLLYTQVWSEEPATRAVGLRAGDAWREAAELIAVYVDLGITDGMYRAVDARPAEFVERRNVHWRAADALRPLATVEQWRERLRNLQLKGFPALKLPHAFVAPKMFLGQPERWIDANTRRCVNGHVSDMHLKSEERGLLCLECGQKTQCTFPEDTDGDRIGAEVFAMLDSQFEAGVRHGKLQPKEGT